MSPGPRIYNLFPLLVGPLLRWRPHLERAARMGFTWVFVNPVQQSGYSGSLYAIKDHFAIDPRFLEGDAPPIDQLRRTLADAKDLGLSPMMDLVLNHTAFDARLVREHPAWFRRDGAGEFVRPGATDGARRVVWGDLVEVDNAGSSDREALWAYWRELALFYVGLGVRGFRCDAAYQVPAPLWRGLIAAVKSRCPDVRFFAETLGCGPEETLATAAAGFDFIFNSSKWWDFEAPWCLEQYERTAPVVASVSFPESHDTPRLAAELAGDRAAVLQRYAFAACFSTGVMMPVGFEYGFQTPLHVVKTSPAEWESATWDLTGEIAAIHRTKAALRPLNEEGPLEALAPEEPGILSLRKRTRDRREAVLLLLNRGRRRGRALRLPSASLPALRAAVTDPIAGTARPLRASGEVALGPAGIALVHARD
jgi:starch synthase (maltosyl-transferring)